MRTCLAFFSFFVFPAFLFAQDDAAAQAAQAAQQAAQQSQQAALQAMRDAQEANQQAIDAAQQAAQNAQTPDPPEACCIWTAPPKLSVKAGTYGSPVTVKITDASRGAVIYYSTDGWAPTQEDSPRYRGPITLDRSTNLQAIAVAPYSRRSIVVSAQYTIMGGPAAGTETNTAALAGVSNLIAVPLVFDANVSSKTAQVGDKVPMVLGQDISINGFVVHKGTAASVTITQVDRTAAGGAPGTLTFEADDLHPASGPIPLQGHASREGEAKIPGAAVLIPMVGPLTVLKHGTDAMIAKGTQFVAYIDAGTPIAEQK